MSSGYDPAIAIGTIASGVRSFVGTPEGVMRNPSRKRTETLPDVPRFRPRASSSRAAATTPSRAARSVASMSVSLAAPR